jgi:NAD(P)-dependent dehydrogenase (short-subunit alcohol dehydrogenase family)
VLLNGLSAVVTGGASGLGAATVRRLAESGARVVAVDHNSARGKKLADECGPEVVFHPGDITDETDIAAAVEQASALGPLRVAVNCAGISHGARLIERDGTPHDLAAFRRVIDVNVVGTFNVVRLAASAMSRLEPLGDGQRGVIVNVSSASAFESWSGTTAYAVSKAAIAGMSLPAARDLAPLGIRVVAIAPGIFETPMFEGLPRAEERLSTVPFPKRSGSPQNEFAALVEHIVTNDYLNGETIRLDGAARFQIH